MIPANWKHQADKLFAKLPRDGFNYLAAIVASESDERQVCPIIAAFVEHYGMTNQQAKVAKRLYQNLGNLVLRESLIAAMNDEADELADPENQLNQVMMKIRAKLRGSSLCVTTEVGIGYCLDGPSGLIESAPGHNAPTGIGAGTD